ncbi:MAG: hypothetical protein GDA40_07215 [Rhodobacteraceae bacterium]|nr:hypothetical protein [Paracoccaceae bacterium]
MTSIREKIVEPKPGLLGLLERAQQLGSVSRGWARRWAIGEIVFIGSKNFTNKVAKKSLWLSVAKKPLPKNRVPEHVERVAIETSGLGQKRASCELWRKGVTVSSSGVRSLWPRNDPDTPKKRSKAQEARAAQDGLLPTEEQMAAPEEGETARGSPVQAYRPATVPRW